LKVLTDLVPMQHGENGTIQVPISPLPSPRAITSRLPLSPRSPFRCPSSFLPLGKRKKDSPVFGTPKLQRTGLSIVLNAFSENELLIKNRSDRIFDLSGWTIHSIKESQSCEFPKSTQLAQNGTIRLFFVEKPRPEPYEEDGAFVIEGLQGFFSIKDYEIILRDDKGAEICNLRHLEAHSPFLKS